METERVINEGEFILGLPPEIAAHIDGGGGRRFNISAVTFLAGTSGQKGKATSRTVTLNLLIEKAGREVFAKPITAILSMSVGDAIWLSERLREHGNRAETLGSE